MTDKSWNGGSREAAIKASNERRELARVALHRKHADALARGLLGPFHIDAPFTDYTYPGWVYLPVDDCVIMGATATRLAEEAALAAVHDQLDATRFRYLREFHAHHSMQTRETPAEWHIEWHWTGLSHQDWSLLHALDEDMGRMQAMQDATCEAELPPVRDPRHASVPAGHKCADCTIDGEACPDCYATWWQKRHPNVAQLQPASPIVAATISSNNLVAWADKIDNRVGPIAGHDADKLALLLRTIAEVCTSKPQEPF